jgi:hypothetical protein
VSNKTLHFSTPSAQESQSKKQSKKHREASPYQQNKRGAKENLDKRDKKT